MLPAGGSIGPPALTGCDSRDPGAAASKLWAFFPPLNLDSRVFSWVLPAASLEFHPGVAVEEGGRLTIFRSTFKTSLEVQSRLFLRALFFLPDCFTLAVVSQLS